MTEQLLTVADVAKAIGLTPTTVYRMVNNGTMPSIKIGGSRRIRPHQLERFRASGWVPPEPPPEIRPDPFVVAQERGEEVKAALASWALVRSRVYIRDRGICAVCQRFVTMDKYECGHVIDRAMGGPDTEDNCVVMCLRCNDAKPLHPTRDEALAWVMNAPARVRTAPLRPRTQRKRPNGAGSLFWDERRKRWIVSLSRAEFGRKTAAFRDKLDAEAALAAMQEAR